MWCGLRNSVSNSFQKCDAVAMRVVVKVGTSSLTNAEGHIKAEVIQLVSAQLAAARAEGHEVLLVTSGAVASGIAGLGLTERPSDVLSLQALSAVGQPQLMAAYNSALQEFSLVAAQVLLVPHDFVDRQQYLHARDTIGRLLELGCIPIINENDAIANNEIHYGDNDHLAALLAHLVSADLLVLLTDTAGLFTSDPRTNSDATVISVVTADDPLLSVSASGAGSNRVLTSNASGLASWSANPNTAIVSITSSTTYTVSANDKYVIYSNTTTGTITLPDASSNGVGSGKEYIIKNISGNSITINTTSSQNIIVDSANNTATSVTLGVEASNNWIRVISDGTRWIGFRALF